MLKIIIPLKLILVTYVLLNSLGFIGEMGREAAERDIEGIAEVAAEEIRIKELELELLKLKLKQTNDVSIYG